MTHILHVEHLKKRYKSQDVVKNVSLQLMSGEIVGLLGPNGAGKTTSFYIIVGLIPPTSGRILFDERDITKLSVHARAALGITYLPQDASIFRKLTVEQNIMAILELQKNLTLQDREQKLEKLLEEFRLHSVRHTLGMRLSGGERRRTEIARALATEPKFILLDEPFAGIDPLAVKEIKLIIQQLKNSSIGVLITDHNVRETLTICKRAYIVNQGSIICEGSPQLILNDERVRKVYLGEEFNL